MSGEMEELQGWYEAQCDGDWEHTYGVHIETLDNPGWSVKIDLVETELAQRQFVPIKDLDPEREWISCEVSEGQFRGFGGAPMLGALLRVFLDWAREAPSRIDASAP